MSQDYLLSIISSFLVTNLYCLFYLTISTLNKTQTTLSSLGPEVPSGNLTVAVIKKNELIIHLKFNSSNLHLQQLKKYITWSIYRRLILLDQLHSQHSTNFVGVTLSSVAFVALSKPEEQEPMRKTGFIAVPENTFLLFKNIETLDM